MARGLMAAMQYNFFTSVHAAIRCALVCKYIYRTYLGIAKYIPKSCQNWITFWYIKNYLTKYPSQRYSTQAFPTWIGHKKFYTFINMNSILIEYRNILPIISNLSIRKKSVSHSHSLLSTFVLGNFCVFPRKVSLAKSCDSEFSKKVLNLIHLSAIYFVDFLRF